MMRISRTRPTLALFTAALFVGGCADDIEGMNFPDGRVVAVRDSGVNGSRDSGIVGGGGDDAGVNPGFDSGIGGNGDGGGAVPENCATPFDDNGDGVANEGCVCTPGTMQMCFQRQEPEFRGMCRMGQQTCMGNGEFGSWGPCERSWLPLPDQMNQCEITQTSTEMMAMRPPVDIIWFIDTSGSMVEETANLNANLNRFAQTLSMSGLDYRVIMVGRRGMGSLLVCVPPPLASANCGDAARFRHINSSVASTNGLSVVIAAYPQFRDFLRADSQKYFVAVTDDESSMSAAQFTTTVNAWPGFRGFVFNSIVGYESRADCPTLARRGGVYITLTTQTMGDKARVCANDWSSIFTTFAMNIARRANSWVLATPARPDTIEVYLVSAGGVRTRLMMGWTYSMATNTVTVDAALIPMGSQVQIIYRPLAGSP